MDEIIVELKSVSKVYDETVALDGINLYIRKNEFVTLLGPSGCGKTTTLRLIGGFEQPTDGTILFEGRDVTDVPPYKRRVNTVFQRYALFSHLDVFENIAFGLRIKKYSEKVIKEKVGRMLEQVNLAGFEKRDVNSLSGGQQQRVAIARALCMEPQILFFDEPTSALDPELTGEILSVMRQLAEEDMTMVIVTHEMSFAADISDKVVFMDNGLIVEEGEAELIKNPQNERTRAFLRRFNS